MSCVSFVIPAYNEESNIQTMVDRIEAISRRLGMESEDPALALGARYEVEIVFVDDHSTDATPAILKELSRKNPHVRYARLARRSGSHIAIVCGTNLARGDCAIVLAADGQDPPELAPEMISRWREGNEVVWCARRRYRRSFINTLCSGFFYWLMRRVSAVSLESQDADMVLLDRKVINVLSRTYERNMYLWGLIDWFGFKQTRILYDKQERMSGSSGWTFMRRLKAAIDALVAFSYAPIRCMSLLGILFSTVSCLLGLSLVVNHLTGGWLFGVVQVTGWASIICAIFFLGGLQILMLGVLGEYLWRTFDQVRGRPLYLVEDAFGGHGGAKLRATKEGARRRHGGTKRRGPSGIPNRLSRIPNPQSPILNPQSPIPDRQSSIVNLPDKGLHVHD
ncbi:MAG: glycosyltransferase family 2 protein [Phycisphaerae bacterium]